MATPTLSSFSSSVMKETSVDFGGKINILPVELSQYDDSEDGKLICIKVTMYKNGEIFAAPSDVTVRIRFGMFGGYFAYYEALGFLTTRSVVIIPVRLQLTAMYGDYRPEIEIVTEDGSTVASAPFSVKIIKSSIQLPYIAQWLRDSSDIGEAVDFAKQAAQSAQAAAASATNASNSATSARQSAAQAETHEINAGDSEGNAEYDALRAEGFAVGKQNGTDVGSDSPYYHNNAKYYSENYKGYVRAGLKSGTNAGEFATAEGFENTSSGSSSHAEGSTNTASGRSSHAEGKNTTASGDESHAEGYNNTASGNMSHAEGSSTTASGAISHTEGLSTIATNDYSHAEGYSTEARGLASHAEGYLTIADTEAQYAHAEGYNTGASGESSHAEGSDTSAEATASHAEGKETVASGTASHAEGFSTTASYNYAHAEGASTEATKTSAHAEGSHTEASEISAHAEGTYAKATGKYSHAEGYRSKAQAESSHAEGSDAEATGKYSHAEGNGCVASGLASHAGGANTIASRNYETAIGRYNDDTSSSSTVTKLVIGSGTSNTARSNCFRVEPDGVYASGAYNSSGADYAELFEWADGNIQNEDRAGKFVTLEGNKIRLATNSDDYVIGIVSGNASIVGDVHDDQWRGMYMYDIFGRPIFEEVELEAEYDERENPETGEVERVEIIPAHRETRQKLNPEYDYTQRYISRTERPEWDAVGLIGKLVAIDDGSCQVNGWATVKYNSIATVSTVRTKYRVIERIDETHVRIFIL